MATLAGSFGAFFHARSKEMDGEMNNVERRLQSEVEQLRERI